METQRTASIFVVISMHISKHRHLLYDVQNQLVQHTFHKDPNKRSIQAYLFLKYNKYLPKCWVEMSLNTRVTVKFFLVKLKQLPITCIDLTWIQTIEFHYEKCESHPWVWTIDLCMKKETAFRVGHFTTIFHHFFANYIYIFHKKEV